jgi:hypothetical protein
MHDQVPTVVIGIGPKWEIQYPNELCRVQQWVVFSSIYLHRVVPRDIVLYSFVEASFICHLHFHDELSARLVGGPNVKNSRFFSRDPRELVWVMVTLTTPRPPSNAKEAFKNDISGVVF